MYVTFESRCDAPNSASYYDNGAGPRLAWLDSLVDGARSAFDTATAGDWRIRAKLGERPENAGRARATAWPLGSDMGCVVVPPAVSAVYPDLVPAQNGRPDTEPPRVACGAGEDICYCIQDGRLLPSDVGMATIYECSKAGKVGVRPMSLETYDYHKARGALSGLGAPLQLGRARRQLRAQRAPAAAPRPAPAVGPAAPAPRPAPAARRAVPAPRPPDPYQTWREQNAALLAAGVEPMVYGGAEWRRRMAADPIVFSSRSTATRKTRPRGGSGLGGLDLGTSGTIAFGILAGSLLTAWAAGDGRARLRGWIG